MRPTTNEEISKALRVQANYAVDSETKWLMEEAARRLITLQDIAIDLKNALPDNGERVLAESNETDPPVFTEAKGKVKARAKVAKD